MLSKNSQPPRNANICRFNDIWALRESLYKLTGDGDLKTMRFFMKNEKIIAPVPGVFCRLYNEIEDSAAAVCSFADNLPDKLIKVPAKKTFAR